MLAGQRLSSLDAFRGLTIGGMILVNNLGSSKYVYAPLRHAEWHGWTPTDLVFPFFLFIVGVSLSFSLSKRMSQRIQPLLVYSKIVKRSLVLFALGIFLALVPRFDFATLRIPGVLQRIALCYLFSSLLFLKMKTKRRAVIAFSLMALYWLVMKLVPVPGYGAGVLDYKGNLCAYIDTKFLAGHLYKPGFDPEGILSTLPAISTTLLGTLGGDWLRSSRGTFAKTAGLFAGGILFSFSGLVLHPYFPINKQLWTSTFVLFSAGVALLVLGVTYGIMEVLKFRKWATPFLILGTNAIFIYVGSSLTAKLINITQVQGGREALSLKAYIYNHFIVPWAGFYIGSLVYPLLLILLWIGIMFPLYKRRIFIKI